MTNDAFKYWLSGLLADDGSTHSKQDDADGKGVDSCSPGSLSTAAAGPSQAQSIQAVMVQLLRMEERFATLESKLDAVLVEQPRYAASSGSTAGPPEAESGRRIPEYHPFPAKCAPGSEEHRGFTQVAQYSDEWVCNKNKNGDVLSAFRSFYICLAGGDFPCCTVIPMKTWGGTLRTDDPFAFNSRWYCVCKARYKAQFGMIIEIEVEGKFYYVKAELPPGNLMNLKAMLNPSSPEELLAMLKHDHVTPHKKQILSLDTQADVVGGTTTKFDQRAYKIDASAYKDLRHFKWEQIVKFGLD